MNRIQIDLPPALTAAYAVIALLAAVGALTVMPMESVQEQSVVFLPLVASVLAVGLVVGGREMAARARQEGRGDSTTDSLTGLATAAAGQHVLSLEFAAAQRGRPLTVVLIRIEGLSAYTREHGRAVTKQLMRKAGRAILHHRRGMHLAARHTVDGTFLSILSGEERPGATVYAQRVRKEVLRVSGVPKPLGVSVGVASFDMSMKEPRELLGHARAALDRGARAGGKVVVVGEATAPA